MQDTQLPAVTAKPSTALEPLHPVPHSLRALGQTAAALEPPPDAGKAARTGLWILGLGLGGFLLWAGLAPLESGVPTHGRVSVDTKLKAVQHLNGGIVKQVLVHEGEMVREGQVLFRLEEASTRAAFESVRQDYLGALATRARLEAELNGASKLRFPKELESRADDPQVRQQMDTQAQLFRSRRAALNADLQVLQEGISGQQAQLQSFEAQLASRKTQLRSLQEEQKNAQDLVKEGYMPRNRLLELERMISDSNAQSAEQVGNIARTRQAISEFRARLVAREQEYRKEIEAQMADVSRGTQSDAQKFSAAQNDLDRTEIRAPASGQVVGLAVQTVGGVITAGAKLADIVPAGEALILEARIEPQMIDRVQAGMAADVRFSAFAATPQLVVEGQVLSVSGDLVVDPQNAALSYFLARVKITDKGLARLGQHPLVPGMPAEIIIKTGERTLLRYLWGPFTKRLAAAFKEE